MKRQIRRGTFETNSSSTHSICITKSGKYNKPDAVCFDFGEYGWERETYSSTYSKADYLYTGIYECFDTEEIENYKEIIKGYFDSEGITCIFKGEGETKSYEYNGKTTYYQSIDGYVDHGNELKEFIKDVCSDKDKLFRYLFSDESFIITGNDNDEEDVNINVSYDHDEYYKWN